MIDITYRKLDSPIHKLGLLPKVLLFGSLGLLSLVYTDTLFLFTIVITCLCLSHLGKVGRPIAGLMKFFTIFALIVFIVNLVANQHGENSLFTHTFRFYFWRINFRVTIESIWAATRMVTRLLALILSFLLFSLTTRPEELMARFSSVRGLEGFGLLLGLAYRFVPTIVTDGIEIKDSLRTRGVRFQEGGRMERARSYASLGVPLLVNSLDRGMQLSEALESRGYGSGRRWVVPAITGNRFDKVASVYYIGLAVTLLCLWIFTKFGHAEVFSRMKYVSLLPLLFLLLILPVAWGWVRDRD